MKLNSFVTVADATKVKVYMKNFGEFYNNQIEAAGTIILSRTQKLNQEKLNADLGAVVDNFLTKSGAQDMDCVEFIPASKDDATMVKAFVEALTGKDAVNYSYSYSTCGKNMEFNDQTGKFETGNFIVLVYEVK